MRVSQYYQLDRTQPSLDFVDVDVYGDLKVFISPRSLRLLTSQWGDECVSIIQYFFQTVLNAIRSGDDSLARKLLRNLKEPNETHLDLSRARARGRALGNESARDVWRALSRSEAVRTGLLEDLEDTILMVEGIDVDIVSDITTNIIRQPLIKYTQNMCSYYDIPLESEVDSGPLSDPGRSERYSELVSLPVTEYGKLLLVPKVIVRRKMEYDSEEYYRHYLLEYLREAELAANTELVHLLKDGRPRVTKKDLIEKYGRGKTVIVQQTLRNPQVLERYRADKRDFIMPPLTHHQIAETEDTDPPDWDTLLEGVLDISTGRSHASGYEKAIEQLLTALFYPFLANPYVQHRIHEGRKRIDITYTNTATEGFFHWLGMHYPAPHVFVECKNYGTEVGNPELDQLAGRFSPSRGQFGLLVCRRFEDKKLFSKRCRDTAMDRRGYIVPLDDDDLITLVEDRGQYIRSAEFRLLMERFDNLIM